VYRKDEEYGEQRRLHARHPGPSPSRAARQSSPEHLSRAEDERACQKRPAVPLRSGLFSKEERRYVRGRSPSLGRFGLSRHREDREDGVERQRFRQS
jgi:hypothetical protein